MIWNYHIDNQKIQWIKIQDQIIKIIKLQFIKMMEVLQQVHNNKMIILQKEE